MLHDHTIVGSNPDTVTKRFRQAERPKLKKYATPIKSTVAGCCHSHESLQHVCQWPILLKYGANPASL